MSAPSRSGTAFCSTRRTGPRSRSEATTTSCSASAICTPSHRSGSGTARPASTSRRSCLGTPSTCCGRPGWNGSRRCAASVAPTRAGELRMTDLRPMLAVAGRLPRADQDDRWACEMKWDGVRMTADVSPTAVRLVGRSGIDATIAYPELQGLSGSLGGRTAVPAGGGGARGAQLAATIPATYLVFDILAVDGLPTTSLPYLQRRELLEAVVAAGPNWQVSPSFVGGGADLLEASRRMGLEGIVAKRLDSPYRPGQRSAEWIKIKNLAIQEVVIGGYTVGHGRREATFGALLLGLPAAGGLTYVGSVGTGFDDHLLDDIAE